MILKYRVLHVQNVAEQKQVEYEGETVTITTNRVSIELTPEGHDGSVIRVSGPTGTKHFEKGSLIEIAFGDAIDEADGEQA